LPQEIKTDYVCKIFNVTHVTIIDWIKKGKLRAFMTGGGHYRVMREDLIKFIKEKGRPIPDDLKASDVKYRILIVDDEKNIIDSVKLMLDRIGVEIEIETATDGLEAGIKLGTFMPNLVILDALMSDDPRLNYFDGYTVVKKIKENPKLKNIKILIFSGYPDEGEKLVKMGADKFIGKASRESEFEPFQKAVCKLLGVKSREVIPNI
jgi:excisionase family DNA binding protein